MTRDLCRLQIHINGQHTFFLNERVMSKYSAKLRKIMKQERRRIQIRNSGIEIDDFPGGAEGFELVSRFCYNNGEIGITVSNVSLLHCCAVFLGMTSDYNLLNQTEIFLQGIFYWSWSDILTCLKSSESFLSHADSCGLIQKLMGSLLAKIAQNSDVNLLSASPSSSTISISSPDTGSNNLDEPIIMIKRCSSKRTWWFEGMTILHPRIIEEFLRAFGAYGSENNNLILTRFLLQYLRTAAQCNNNTHYSRSEYRGLADTAVNGVILMGRSAFSCRGLFWVLRVVSGFGLSGECRAGLEKLIGGMLDEATLDDLLVSGGDSGVYDVNLVLRLIKLFVHHQHQLHKMKKVGKLLDLYLGEIGPDPSLKVSKFIKLAESLPDCSRDCFDGVFRAIDIYLESHPALSLEERSRLCRCLNYEKLSLEACKDLAKNPRIPPRITVRALASQRSSVHQELGEDAMGDYFDISSSKSNKQMVLYKNDTDDSFPEEKEYMAMSLQRMQYRVVELEKLCREMRSQMSRMVKIGPPHHSKALPRLC